MPNTPRPDASTAPRDNNEAWDKPDDWPTPEARDAAQRHRAADDDNPLESIGKAISAPVIDAGDPDAAEAIERKR